MAATVAPPAALPRAPGLRDRLRAARARRRGAEVGAGVTLGRGLVVEAGPGARIVLGDGCSLGDGCRLHVRHGEVVIGPGAVLGERCVVVAHERITIGARALLADEVVLVDFDHRFDDPEAPVRLQGLETAPIDVGDGARIGPGAALLRGVRVGAGAQVGAHAVVTADVAPRARVEGVPARPPAARGRGPGARTRRTRR